MPARTQVLLTGFGPFPGVPVNATMHLVPLLAEAAPRVFPDVRFAAMLLATEWESAPARVLTALPEMRPDLIVHFGVSSRARGFEIETRARNICQISQDAAGQFPSGIEIDGGGRDYLAATLPARHVVGRLRQLGIPAFASRDAGTYLCNALLYRTLAAQAGASATRIGFVHIPASLARPGSPSRGRSGACPLTWEQSLRGGLEIIAASLGRPRPRRETGPLTSMRGR